MQINIERLMRTFNQVGNIGGGENGVTRLPNSPAYKEAAGVLAGLMEEAGMTAHIDSVGNVIGCLPGKDASLKHIAMGSHLDTVADAGLYDGNLGIHAALECVNAMRDAGYRPNRSIEVIGFNFEEGSELGGTFGSRAMMGCGDALLPEVKRYFDKFGLDERKVSDAKIDAGRLFAFFELHPEQGSRLEKQGLPIGVVDSIIGIERYVVTVNGEYNAAGTTPMSMRKDSLFAAARLICEIERLSGELTDPFVATVGRIEAFPGLLNVIPGKTELYLEIRDIRAENMRGFMDRLNDFIAAEKDFKITVEQIIDKPPLALDAGLVSMLENLCRERGISSVTLPSFAGHDAKVMAAYVPAVMIFVPSAGGISHNKLEYTDPADIKTGTELLLEAVLKLDAAPESGACAL